jgi:ferredoxin
MPVIKFVNEKKEIEVPHGANLRAEAVKAGINMNCLVRGVSEGIDKVTERISKVLNCHGFGVCGTCRVRITSGIENTNPLTFCEKVKFKYVPFPDFIPLLAYLGNEDTMRLACRTKVHGDITVESKPELNLFGESFFS